MPQVSVIIPSYNHEKYVAEAIQSVLDQSFQDLEVVITDDGSTDGTVHEINKFNDPRLRLFRFEKNQGAALAVAHSVKHSRGKYLALLNSDDLFLPKKIEEQVKFIESHQEIGAVFTLVQPIDEAGDNFRDQSHIYYSIFRQPNRSRHDWLRHFFFHGNCLCHPSVLVHRRWYTEKSPPDPRLAQLGDFNRWIKICLESEIHIIQKELVKFRIRSGEANASAGTPENIRRSLFEYRQLLEHYLSITNLRDLVLIFPEVQKLGKPLHSEMIPYYIARVALSVSNPIYEDFGLKTLFTFLGDKDKRMKMLDQGLFSFSDFIQLTGKTETWRVPVDSFVFPPLFLPPLPKTGRLQKFRKFFSGN